MLKCVFVEVLLVLVSWRGKRLVGVSGEEELEAQEVQAAVQWLAVQQELQELQVALVAQ